MQIQKNNNQPNFGISYFNQNSLGKASSDEIIEVNQMLRRVSRNLEAITKDTINLIEYRPLPKSHLHILTISDPKIDGIKKTMKNDFKRFYKWVLNLNRPNVRNIELEKITDEKFLEKVEESVKGFKEH